jgi:Domain of unknown function (DUF7007)
MQTAMQTPWGELQGTETIAPDLEFVSTAGHGGIKVSMPRNHQIPNWLKNRTHNQLGRYGWYEEDCDWCIPVIIFARESAQWAKRLGKDDFIKEAYRIFNHYHLPEIDTLSTADRPEEPGLYLGLYQANQAVPYVVDSRDRQGPLIGPLTGISTAPSVKNNLQLVFAKSLDALKYGLDIDHPVLLANEEELEYQSVTYAEWYFTLIGTCR